ncbi:MAG: hypothetical protein PHT76_04230 [Anaerostipes sp.]|nr:hypothetical protein [Anaerostipes sp.]
MHYEDIIDLPHHVSKKHPQMSRKNRAAQFAPFAALTGYEDAILETGRLTDKKIELDEDARELLDIKLQMISCHLEEKRQIKITYFKEDERKDGGAYVTVEGVIKKISTIKRDIFLQDRTKIRMDDIIELEIK